MCRDRKLFGGARFPFGHIRVARLKEANSEREVDEPQAIIAAVAAGNYKGTLCRIRMLREQRDDPI
jgi:hypothetical protein